MLDEQQAVVGSRNRGSWLQNLHTRPAGHEGHSGLQFFNLTDHFNPRDVQSNLDTPTFGELANSVDRQVRFKFALLF